MCRVLELLGTPPHPWQRDVADVLLEYRPENGAYHYGTAGICADRQAGKTRWVLGRIGLQLMLPRQLVLYLSYDRSAGRVKWMEQVSELMSCVGCGERVPARTKKCPHCSQPPGFASRVRSVTYQNQQECLYMANGSRYMISTPSGRGGRSLSADLVVLDEAFSFEDMRALGAIQPTLATKPLGQFIVLSSAGTGASVLLQHFRDLGHAATEGDLDTGELDELGGALGWFEWCPADPNAPHDDPRTWEQACPSIGLPGGPTYEAFANAAATLPRDIFGREWLNFTSEELYVPLVSPEAWARCRSDDPIIGEPTLGIAVNADRDQATLSAAGLCLVGDMDRCAVEVLLTSSDVDAVVRMALEVAERQGAAIYVGGNAPAAARAALLARRGVDVRTLNTPEVVQAVGDMYDAIKAGNVAHRDDYRLNDALAGAVKRKVGQSWVWAPSSSAVDTTPLDSVTLARWGAVSTLVPAVF
jgi:hypothetical protein